MLFDMKTSLGTIRLELDAEKAPDTVANFKEYADSGFYNGTIFHRVIPNFMIQGGGFEPGLKQKTTKTNVKNEANNGLKNHFATIAMARTGDPHSATAQFFINTTENPFLDFTAENSQGWGYCVFGKVVEGEDVLKEISAVSTETMSGHENVPQDDIIIESIAPPEDSATDNNEEN